MPAIQPLDPAQATGATAETLAAVKRKLGRIPNLFTTLARSSAALQAYVRLGEALETGAFSAKQREQVALAVAEANACGYCLAAHSAIGGLVGLTPAEVAAARQGRAPQSREDAIVSLARRIVEARGHLSAAEIAGWKARGLSDADILETLSVVVVNILTNYTNHIAGTEVDFPAVPEAKAA